MSSSGGQAAGTTGGTGGIGIATTATVPVVVPLINDSSNYRGLLSARNTSDGGTGANLQTVASMLEKSGALFDFQRTPDKFIPLNAVSIAAEATLWTPAAGKKFRLMGFSLASGTVGGGITLKDNTAGTTILIVPTATVAVAVNGNLGNGILSAAANNVLTGTGIATETVTGYLFGTEE